MMMLSSLSIDSCWLVGCVSQVNLYCNSIKNFTSYDITQYSPTNQNLEYIPVWPFLDIHISPSTVINCNISDYAFNCSSFTSNLSELSVQWVGEYQQSVKTLTKGNMSKVFVYLTQQELFIVKLDMKIYAVAQEGYKIYIWTSSGIYTCNRNVGET